MPYEKGYILQVLITASSNKNANVFITDQLFNSAKQMYFSYQKTNVQEANYFPGITETVRGDAQNLNQANTLPSPRTF